MGRRIAVFAVIALLLAAGCSREERPEEPDGSGTIVVNGTLLVTAEDTLFFPGSVIGESAPLDGAEVILSGLTSIRTETKVADERGEVLFDNLATGRYSVFVRRDGIKDGKRLRLYSGYADITITGDGTERRNVSVKSSWLSSLMISEVFYAGSCSSTFYFYDQFVELYNASEDTVYLDNIIVTRQAGVKDPEMETKDYVQAIYAFQLKGTGRQYPLLPDSFAVIAADAVNHRQFCSNSPDLSRANPYLAGEGKLYECFNPLGGDYDVVSVPNFVNIFPGKTVDYLINLSHNAVVIARGGNYVIDENNYMQIPIDSVIDGVEYNSNPAYSKEMTVRIDAGFAGIGITRYSGQSTERQVKGLDTNNSTFDFLVLPRPTPGRFH